MAKHTLKILPLKKLGNSYEMKLNKGQCHVLLNSQRHNFIKIGNLCKDNSSCENLLGINFNFVMPLYKFLQYES